MNRINKVLSFSALLLGTAIIYRMGSNKKSESLKNESNQWNKSEKFNHDNTEQVVSNNENLNKNNSNERSQKMFKDLKMTKDQRERYEASIKSLTSNWEKNNPNVQMDDKDALSEEDKSLKSVLNEIQYGMYRDWTEKYTN